MPATDGGRVSGVSEIYGGIAMTTMENFTGLAACPFCGRIPRLMIRPDDAGLKSHFASVVCYCGGYSACAHKMATAPTAEEAEDKVRSAWNCRSS